MEKGDRSNGRGVFKDTGAYSTTHASEIARGAPKEEWPKWVEKAEKEKLTVVELKKKLRQKSLETVKPTPVDGVDIRHCSMEDLLSKIEPLRGKCPPAFLPEP